MKNFVVLDVETSGLNPEEDKVVELAWATRQDGKVVSSSQFVYTEVEIPAEASAIHHIVNADIAGARGLDDILISNPIPDGYIVAHNAPFDKKFLPSLQDRKWIDTLRVAKHVYPDLPNYKNQTIRYALNLKPELPENLFPHRALYDVLVTLSIVEKMLEQHSLEELFKMSYTPVLLPRVFFGKHRGALWKEVPKDYLRWLLRSEGIDPDVKHTVEHWLAA